MKTILRSLGMGVAASIVSLVTATAPAQADAILYMNFSNAAPDGPAYVRIDITGSGTTWDLSFDALTAPSGPFVPLSNFGIQSMGFNIPTATATITNLPSGWSATVNPGANLTQDGFGDFDVDLSGTGGNRQDPLTFRITFGSSQADGWWEEGSTGGGTEGNGWWFAGHIADFSSPDCTGNANCTSAFFATADNGFPPQQVPEPGGLLIVVTAMGMLALFLRRRGTA